MRGSAIETSRSRNSYIRSPRSVTRAPIGMPSRILKPAIDLRARRTCARCPAIVVSSSIALSSALASVLASPTPMFSVIFSIRGTCMIVLKPSSSLSCSRTPSFPSLRPLSPVDLLAAVRSAADADPRRAALDVARDGADTGRAIADGADDHHVRDRDRAGLFDHAAGLDLRSAHPARIRHRARARVSLDHVQVLDDDAALFRARLEDPSLLAAILAAQHLHQVALPHLHRLHQRTSGASETIFMKFFSRSSRATGPKMRVPRGLLCASMITAAFSSNAIDVPSSRPYGFFVRTTTARTTSPLRTAPCGVAVLTVPTMTSPTLA